MTDTDTILYSSTDGHGCSVVHHNEKYTRLPCSELHVMRRFYLFDITVGQIEET